MTDITSLVKSCTREVNVAGTAKVSFQMGRGTKQTRGCNTSTVGIYILDNILDSLEAQTPCLVAVAASRERDKRSGGQGDLAHILCQTMH